MVAKVKIPTSPTARFFNGEVRGVAVHMEAHIASVVADGSAWVGRDVVEKLVDCVFRVNCRCGLVGCQCIKGDEHRTIDCSCVIEKGSDNALDAFDFGCGENGEIRFFFGVLYFGPVVGTGPCMGRMLWLDRWGVGPAVEELGNVLWHGDVNASVCVVPGKAEATI